MNQEEKEEFESCNYRIKEEGIWYCFDGYSRWKEIKDEQFHKLREEFLKVGNELRQYVKNKAEKN